MGFDLVILSWVTTSETDSGFGALPPEGRRDFNRQKQDIIDKPNKGGYSDVWLQWMLPYYHILLLPNPELVDAHGLVVRPAVKGSRVRISARVLCVFLSIKHRSSTRFGQKVVADLYTDETGKPTPRIWHGSRKEEVNPRQVFITENVFLLWFFSCLSAYCLTKMLVCFGKFWKIYRYNE